MYYVIYHRNDGCVQTGKGCSGMHTPKKGHTVVMKIGIKIKLQEASGFEHRPKYCVHCYKNDGCVQMGEGYSGMRPNCVSLRHTIHRGSVSTDNGGKLGIERFAV